MFVLLVVNHPENGTLLYTKDNVSDSEKYFLTHSKITCELGEFFYLLFTNKNISDDNVNYYLTFDGILAKAKVIEPLITLKMIKDIYADSKYWNKISPSEINKQSENITYKVYVINIYY